MNLKNLTLAEQLSEGKLLCEANSAIAQIFGKDAMVMMVRDKLSKRNEVLETIQLAQGALSQEVQQLTDEALMLDADNDRDIGAVEDVGRGAIVLAQDAALADALGAALARIFATPRAQLVVGSYAGMAGEADRVARALTAEDRAALAQVRVGAATLLDALERWMQGCRSLTQVSQRRDQLLAQQDATRVSSGAVTEARHAWIRDVHTLVAVVEGSDTLSADERTLALASLRATVKRAAERAASRAAT